MTPIPSAASGASCTVIVCSRNRPDALDECLDAIARLDYPDYRVLVVDSASTDGRTQAVARKWQSDFLRADVPGLSYARNLGARASTTEFVAFTDDDAVPDEKWLRHLLAPFEEPAVAGVAGRILPLQLDTDAQRYCAAYEASLQRTEPRVFDRRTANWFVVANFGGIGNGGNMAFRRRAFADWPGFDVRLGRGGVVQGGEESHAFSSLIDCGHRIAYAPDAVVRHPYVASFDELRAQRIEHFRTAVAYLAFLFREQPHHRGALCRYVADAIWRRCLNPVRSSPNAVVSRTRMLLALMAGVPPGRPQREGRRSHPRDAAAAPLARAHD